MQLDKLSTLKENDIFSIGKKKYQFINGTLQSTDISVSNSQKQTQGTFGFKWKKEDTFDSPESLSRMQNWLLERYQEPKKWLSELKTYKPLILDAGCGAGMSGFEYWGEQLHNIQYFGVDISEAVDVARKRYLEKGFNNGFFMQDSIDNLPFLEPHFDIIFSEGVMHHTDSTQNTFNHLCRFLKPGGLFMFYIYRKKGPLREYTDDYIRNQLQEISSEEVWNELKGLTRLGIELGKLDIEINIPEEIKTLEIPAGKINLQRLFYWHIFKAFYDPKLSFEEMHHINFDWYAPKNAHRHTLEEVHQWCSENNLEIQHEREELAGITCIAKKMA